MSKQPYTAPEAEILFILTEAGFASSGDYDSQLTDYWDEEDELLDD